MKLTIIARNMSVTPAITKRIEKKTETMGKYLWPETEMQIKEAAYTSFQKQYLATQARLQENTPVYTIIQSATIPPRSTTITALVRSLIASSSFS